MVYSIEQLSAIETIRCLKSRYFRGVDSGDGALVRRILAEDCVLDYRGCCTDPASGHDYFPAMNTVMEGRTAWPDSGGLGAMGIVSVHQSHDCDIEFTGSHAASAIFSMTDRLYMPEGWEYSMMQGFGFYHETYELLEDGWQLKTLRIQRIRVESH